MQTKFWSHLFTCSWRKFQSCRMRIFFKKIIYFLYVQYIIQSIKACHNSKYRLKSMSVERMNNTLTLSNWTNTNWTITMLILLYQYNFNDVLCVKRSIYSQGQAPTTTIHAHILKKCAILVIAIQSLHKE